MINKHDDDNNPGLIQSRVVTLIATAKKIVQYKCVH